VSTVIRTAGLPGQPDLAPGYITLSYDENIDAHDDLITLERGYWSPDGAVEDAYSVYRGGPGFGTFERAINHTIPIEQAVRWWDYYRDDFAVLQYRALWAVDAETEARRAHPAPVTRDDLRHMLSCGDPIDDRRQASAIECAIRDQLLHQQPDGGLQVTAAGQDTLFAAAHPDRLGEANRLLLGPVASNPVRLAAGSFPAAVGGGAGEAAQRQVAEAPQVSLPQAGRGNGGR